MAYPVGFWLEFVRSSSEFRLEPSATGAFVWLRTSDGEPLERQFFGVVGWTSPFQFNVPAHLRSLGLGGRFRFRKSGEDWLPSDAGISFGDAIWDAGGVYRFFEQLPPVAPSFTDSTGDAIAGRVGTAIAPVTVPAAAGTPAPAYAVVGSLPGGLAFNAGTRTLSGTPTAVASGTIRIRATNSQGSADWTVAYAFAAAESVPGAILIGGVRVVAHDHTGKRLFVHIGDRLIYAPPSLAIAPLWNDDTGDPISAVVGTVIDPITVPAVDAGSPAPAYTASGLPAGLAFDPATRIISGTPLGLAITGTAGTAITPVTLPQATGSPAPAYTVSGLPAGLAFDPNTRTISGTPSAAGTGTITMTATNAAGTATYERDYAFGSG